MLNFSAATGRTLVGFIADRIGPVNALWSVIMLSGLTQLFVWTFVSNYAGIVRTRYFPRPSSFLLTRSRLSFCSFAVAMMAPDHRWRLGLCTGSYAAASCR